MADITLTVPRLQNQNQDPFEILPSELLAIIFELACDFDETYRVRRKLELGSVCSRWRRILWGMPHLWNAFSCSSHLAIRSNPGIIKLLELHALNAAKSNLSFTLDIHSDDPYDPSILYPICHLIFSTYSDRTRSLALLTDDEDIWKAIMDYASQSSFSQLEILDLAIYLLDDGLEKLKQWGSRLPKLCSLSLTVPTFDVCNTFPLHNITSLHLKNIHANSAFYLLSQCPKLIEFCVKDTDADDDYMPPGISEPVLIEDVICAHLIRFEWHRVVGLYGNLVESSSFIRHFKFPSVKHLEWVWLKDGSIEHWEIWKSFFHNMDGIEHIRITTEGTRGVSTVTAGFLALFMRQPIRRMKLDVCSLEELQICLGYLVFDTTSPSFTRLESLEIRVCYFMFSIDECLCLFKLLVAILVSRRPPIQKPYTTTLRVLHLDFAPICTIWWQPQATISEEGKMHLLALRQLRDEGLELHGIILELFSMLECDDAM